MASFIPHRPGIGALFASHSLVNMPSLVSILEQKERESSKKVLLRLELFQSITPGAPKFAILTECQKYHGLTWHYLAKNPKHQKITFLWDPHLTTSEQVDCIFRSTA